jgi:spoIIIJ-associated protein
MLQRDSEVLFALQFLLNRMARRRWPGLGRIHLSCDAVQKRRDEELIELAREVAQQVARTGKPKLLPPLNAYERRLIHLTVREFDDLVSTSDGDGALKRVKISKSR